MYAAIAGSGGHAATGGVGYARRVVMDPLRHLVSEPQHPVAGAAYNGCMFVIRRDTPPFSDVAGHVSRSVVAVAVGTTIEGAPNIIGTAFAIETSEFYATCWHVAEAHDELLRSTPEQLKAKRLSDNKLRLGVMTADESYIWREADVGAWMRFVDKEQDVCVYRVLGVQIPPLVMRRSEQRRTAVGEDVGIAGFPMGNYLQGGAIRPLAVRSVVSGASQFVNETGTTIAQVIIGSTVAGGFSGGPIFSAETGEAIGMIASKLLEPVGPDQFRLPAGLSLGVAAPILLSIHQRSVEGSSKYLMEAVRRGLDAQIPDGAVKTGLAYHDISSDDASTKG